jgi:hypothetical protein
MKKLFVIIASVALIAAFAVSAPAADWSFYGNARMATFIVDQDFGDATFALATGDDDDEDLVWDLQGNSRVGATVKGDNLSARFEYGTGVNLRRLYGEYDFGGFKLKIGQDYTPVTEFISGQAFDTDLGLIGAGNFYGGRAPQIAVSFGNFEVAFIRPTGTAALGLTVAEDVDETLPRIEAKFKYSGDAFSFHVFGGYQTYEIETAAGALVSDPDIDSTVIGVGGTFNLGPLTLGAQVSDGENIGVPWFHYNGNEAYPSGQSAVIPGGVPTFAAGDLRDVDTMQWMVNGIWKVSDTLSLEGGVGFKEDDIDVPGAQDDDQMIYYVQALIEIAPGVTLQPEVGVIDYKDSFFPSPNDDEGDVTYYGAKWQINF